MPRGGSRQGKPGVAYNNRTDLNAGPRIAAPTGQAYGEAGAQIAAQQAVPMAPPPPSAPPVPLGAPSQRPGEPVQSGLSLGPGAGPESISALNPATPNPDLLAFAQYLPTLELLTSLPNASTATRNFVRLLRSSLPIDMPR